MHRTDHSDDSATCLASFTLTYVLTHLAHQFQHGRRKLLVFWTSPGAMQCPAGGSSGSVVFTKGWLTLK